MLAYPVSQAPGNRCPRPPAVLGEKGDKKVFHVVLMRDEQIAARAVAARLVEREHLHWIHMDHQWQLPLVHLVVALRAPRKPHVLIGIEKEAVLRGLLSKLCGGFLFPRGNHRQVSLHPTSLERPHST